MTTDNYQFHSAKEIKEDLDAGRQGLAGAKLFEDYKANASSFKSVADELKTMTASDKNWCNDIEIVPDDKGGVKEVFVKTVPFTGTFFAPKLFDSNDEKDSDPTKNLEAWNRVQTFNNLRSSEAQKQ